jgi:hypothetical protein
LAKEFAVAAAAHARLHGRDCLEEEDFRFVWRLACDTVPRARMLALEAVGEPASVEEVGAKARVRSTTTMRRMLEDLEALGLVARYRNGGEAAFWVCSDLTRQLMVAAHGIPEQESVAQQAEVSSAGCDDPADVERSGAVEVEPPVSGG